MKVRKLVTVALLAAIGFVLSPILRVPGYAAPMQHFINVTAAVLVGPWYGLLCGCLIQFFKITLMGTDLMGITGTIFGVVLSGILYRRTGNLYAAAGGEVFGTGIIGAMCSFPISRFVYGNANIALFTYIPAYLLSTMIGSFCALVLLKSLDRAHYLIKLQKEVNL